MACPYCNVVNQLGDNVMGTGRTRCFIAHFCPFCVVLVSSLEVFDPCEVGVVLPDNHRVWCTQLHGLFGKGGLDSGKDVGLAWTGCALVGVADRKWEDAKTAAENGMTLSLTLSSLP